MTQEPKTEMTKKKIMSASGNFTNLSDESFSLWLLLISAFLFSGMGCFLKLASEIDGGLPSTQLVFYRATFQGFFVVLAMCLTRENDESTENDDVYDEQKEFGKWSDKTLKRRRLLIFIPFGSNTKVIRVVIARGILGGCGFIMYFYSMSAVPLGDAVTLFSLYPIHTLLLARVFLNEQIRTTHIIATIASVVGATLIAGPTFLFLNESIHREDNHDIVNPLGYMTAFVGSFFGSFVIILIRKAGTLGVSALQLLFSWATFGITFSFVFKYVFEPIEGQWRTPPSTRSWLYIFAMCSIGSMAHFLMNYAGRMGPAGLSSIVRSSDILFAYLWQILIFDDIVTLATILGVICVLSSLIVIALQKWKDETDKQSNIIYTNLNQTLTKINMVKSEANEEQVSTETSKLIS